MQFQQFNQAPILTSAKMSPGFVAARMTPTTFIDESIATSTELAGLLANQGYSQQLLKIAEMLPAYLCAIVHQQVARYGGRVH